MIRIVLILLLFLAVYTAINKLKKAPPALKARMLRYALLTGMCLLLLVLGIAGGLGGLFALLGVAFAFLLRLLPSLLQNAPYLQQIWAAWLRAKQQGQHETPRAKTGQMTKAEAYQVLGLPIGAGDKEIIDAHRRLMQKIHPDRGGSDYLAAQINLAKKTLLGR